MKSEVQHGGSLISAMSVIGFSKPRSLGRKAADAQLIENGNKDCRYRLIVRVSRRLLAVCLRSTHEKY